MSVYTLVDGRTISDSLDTLGCPAEPSAADLADLHELRLESAACELLGADDRLTLTELAQRQSDFYRSWGTEAGDLFADHMDELVAAIRITSSASVAEYEARAPELHECSRQNWLSIGYRLGETFGCVA